MCVCVSIHVCILNAICANNCKYIEIWNRNVCIRHDHYYSCIHKMIHMTCHPSHPNAVFRVAQLLTFIAGLVKSEACSIHHLHKGLHIEAFQVHVSRVVLGGHGLVEIRDKTGEKRRLLCRVYMCSFAIVCVFCSSFTTIFIYMWSYIIYGFYMFLSSCELGCVFRHLFHTFSRKQMQTLRHSVDESSGAGLTRKTLHMIYLQKKVARSHCQPPFSLMIFPARNLHLQTQTGQSRTWLASSHPTGR